jgi:hypothetical protein
MNLDVLNYPRSGDQTGQTIILGGLLVLLSVFLIPAVLLVGYLLRVLRGSAADEPKPPAVDDLADLFTEGLRGGVVVLVYGLIPLFGAAVVVGGLVGIAADFGALGVLGVLTGGLLWLGLSLAVSYVAPAALANVAQKRTIDAGFDWETLVPVLKSEAYASAWVAGVLVVLVAGAIASLLNFVPVIGAIGSAFVMFYALVVAYHVIGLAWGDHAKHLLSVEPDVGGETERSTA